MSACSNRSWWEGRVRAKKWLIAHSCCLLCFCVWRAAVFACWQKRLIFLQFHDALFMTYFPYVNGIGLPLAPTLLSSLARISYPIMNEPLISHQSYSTFHNILQSQQEQSIAIAANYSSSSPANLQSVLLDRGEFFAQKQTQINVHQSKQQ